MTRPRSTKECALCGTTEQLTHEHVPPKNLFLPPRPTNTITVTLCAPCNSSFHLNDEYFRVYVTTGAEPGSQLGTLWKEKVVGSSFTRSGGLKGRLQDEYEVLRQYAATKPLEFETGEPVPEELLPLLQAFDATRINAVVEKIVKCLHLYHTGTRLNATITIETINVPENEKRQAITKATGRVGDKNEFVYSTQSIAPGQDRWLLVFYEHRAFRVLVRHII